MCRKKIVLKFKSIVMRTTNNLFRRVLNCTHGIRSLSNDWFVPHLIDRKQKSFVNGYLSDNCSLSCAIPHGTIPVPPLFVIYINDLPSWLSQCQPRVQSNVTSYNIDCIDFYLNQNLINISD